MNGRTRRGRPERGAVFGVGVALGWATIAYGAWIVLTNAGETRPANMALFSLGLVLAHDLLVVPTAVAAASVLRSHLPRGTRGAVAGAVMTSALAVAFILPAAIGRAEKVAGNPTIVPRNPWVSVAIVLAGVWAVTAIVIVRRRRGEARERKTAS